MNVASAMSFVWDTKPDFPSVAARECYVAMMEIDDHLQAMNIEEHRIATEPVEKLEEVLLDDSNHEQTTKIGTLASPTIR